MNSTFERNSSTSLTGPYARSDQLRHGSEPAEPVDHDGGNLSGGFGVIDTFATAGSLPTAASAPILTPRTGTLIARFTF